MGRLDGKVAIVTGAARGQGEATARIFAEEGAKVAVVDVVAEGARKVAGAIGDAARPYAFDISQEAGWQAMVDDLVDRWGRVDVLINNAAIMHTSTLLDLEAVDFQRVLNVNLIGSWAGIKIAGRQMVTQGSGSIVNVLSVAALHGINGLGPYVSSKWALRGLNKTAAMELGPLGVRVNAIFPGGIASPMAGVDYEPREKTNRRFVGQPIARIGEPEEVAYTSLFLASDQASYLSGAEIAVDGGTTVGKYYPFLPGAPAAMTGE